MFKPTPSVLQAQGSNQLATMQNPVAQLTLYSVERGRPQRLMGRVMPIEDKPCRPKFNSFVFSSFLCKVILQPFDVGLLDVQSGHPVCSSSKYAVKYKYKLINYIG